MNATVSCPQCGRTLPMDAPSGVCPQCLLGVGMRAGTQTGPPERRGGFTPPKPQQLAQHFPQLEILDLIGHGGMGAVYKARQRGLDRLVALKILPPEVGQDPSFSERFAREARALAKLSHSNIVGVHDSGKAGGLYYLLMEYVDGVNLREAIQTNELTPAEALAIVPQICDALQYAHDEGIVHRDIKPENILLDKKGRVKIADFGLARLLEQAPDNFTLTGTHQIMGTPRYMAPEQMEGSHEVDHRADIYSLGVVFYEMLTGELPLGRFDVPSHKVQLDVRIDDVVLRTLEKEPARRYQQAGEIKTAVESISQFANMPPQMRQMYGYDYRSKTELFGWPLVHITAGIDPKTGRTRVAKGIIAIGPKAIGGFAMGGVACGVFAFGGAAAGLFTFGGAALGLLVAIGGAAVGLGFSIGGFAFGTVAVGGMAIGYYAFGGAAVADHGMSSFGNDPQAARFFEPWAMPLMRILPIFATVGMLLFVFGITIFVAIVKKHGQEVPPRRDVRKEHRSASGAGCAVAALLLMLIAGGCLFSGALLLYYVRHIDISRAAQTAAIHDTKAAQQAEIAEQQARQAVEDAKRRIRERSDAGHWKLTDEGPVLNEFGERAYNLRPDQISKVNQILQSVYRQYLEAEQQHTSRATDEVGHLVITIREFPKPELEMLEASLWTQLDEVLDLDQQKSTRSNLTVHAGEGIARSALQRWKPGILGWGRDGARIELWKLGTWFHWQARIKVDSRLTMAPGGSAPELPFEFARFWTEDPAQAANQTAAESAIDSEPSPSQE